MVLKVHETEDVHFRVLRLLEANPATNQRELAEELGVSLGKTNYCLKALLAKGMLKMHNFQSSKRKLAYAYLLTPQGIAEKAALTGRFLQRKMDEYAVLKAEIESLKQEQKAEPDTTAVRNAGTQWTEN
jgi:EPS-associated MarR family transcriptional regulator